MSTTLVFSACCAPVVASTGVSGPVQLLKLPPLPSLGHPLFFWPACLQPAIIVRARRRRPLSLRVPKAIQQKKSFS